MTILINAYSTLRKSPVPQFPHVLRGHRDRSDPELESHLNDFVGYVVGRNGGTMTRTVYHLIRHIQRVRNHCSMEVEGVDLDAFSQWAWRANCVCFMPDGSLRDPSGNVLVHPNGADPDPLAQIPYPRDAVARKARNDAKLAASGLRVPPTLPPVIGASEVVLREAGEAATRSLALLVTSIWAESLEIGQPISLSEIQTRCAIGLDALSAAEREFMLDQVPRPEDAASFIWRYEAVALLQWALGLSAGLAWPSSICDVPMTTHIGLGNNSPEFIRTAALRSTTEILDALDLHCRLHWAIRQASLDGRELPARLNAGVVQERHRALNWLIRFEDKDWDNVDTPT